MLTAELKERTRSAVRELRKAMKMSQPTLQRYEQLVPPRGERLTTLEKLASDNGLSDLATVFHEAIVADGGTVVVEPLIAFRSDAEKQYVAALLAVFRNEQYAENLKKVKKLLAVPLVRCLEILDEFQEHNDALQHAQELLGQGKTAEEVAVAINQPVEFVNMAAIEAMMRGIKKSLHE
jgi:transcriptional regulator with XRE-family HTH domain